MPLIILMIFHAMVSPSAYSVITTLPQKNHCLFSFLQIYSRLICRDPNWAILWDSLVLLASLISVYPQKQEAAGLSDHYL